MRMVYTGSEPMLYGDIDRGHLIPIALMGEGMVRLTNLFLRIASAENGVILTDEIENGLHHSILLKGWQAVGRLAREFNVQLFLTTHSYECIVAAHKAFRESESYDFALCRLERTKEGTRAISYDKEALAGSVEAGLEMTELSTKSRIF